MLLSARFWLSQAIDRVFRMPLVDVLWLQLRLSRQLRGLKSHTATTTRKRATRIARFAQNSEYINVLLDILGFGVVDSGLDQALLPLARFWLSGS
jgi:hypothetical protein